MIVISRFRHLLAVGWLLAFASVAKAAPHAGTESVIEMPFDLVHGAVIVHAMLEGQGPFSMMLDSGADPSIVDIHTARAVALKVSKDGGPGGGGGTDANLAYTTKIGALQLSALQARQVDALAMDLSGLSKALGLSIQGVLGRSLMKGRVIQIDYPKRAVRFLAASPSRGRDEASDTPQRTTLRYRYRDDILLAGVKVNGKAATANLDTGASGAFQIAPKAVVALGLSGELKLATVSHTTGFNGAAENRIGQVDRIDVGSISVSHPTVAFDAPGTGRDDVNWSVRIGSAFLQDYIVTIDDRLHTVRMEKP